MSSDKPPIIDVHQHAFNADKDQHGNPLINPVTGKPSKATTDEKLITETIHEMKKNNIKKALTCGTIENLQRWTEAAPELFIPSPHIQNKPLTPTVKEVKDGLENGTLKAIGEITTQYRGIPHNDPVLDPYYKLAVEYDVPVWIHVGGNGAFMPTFRIQAGNPLYIEDVIVKYPDIRLCLSHAGWPFKAQTIALMLQYPQLYADFSCINWLATRESFYDYLRELILYGWNLAPGVNDTVVYGEPIVKRLMYGSDQMYWPETISMSIETIEQAPFLSEEQKRDIFYNNAKRFLKL